MARDDVEGGFKVTDRRGRADADEPPRTPPVQSARPVSSPQPPPEPLPTPAPAGQERSLVGLFMMLGSSALMALGEAADPATGERQRDLPAAAEVIDILLLLREKTEGRRSAEETQVMDEWLYDLQLRYVSTTKRSG
jgi:hypothetical protein